MIAFEHVRLSISRRTLLTAGMAWMAGRPTVLRGQTDDIIHVFVGTFTDAFGAEVPAYFGGREAGRSSRGIYSFAFDTRTGRPGPIALAAAVSNPFNLTVHANRRVLYACGWPTPPDGHNLTAFAIDGASLRPLNASNSGGGGPNVGVVDRTGQNLLLSNFVTDSIVCVRLHEDGSLGERSAFIGRPGDAPGGPHAVTLSRTERFALVPEIHANQCRVLRFDARTGSLETHQLAPDLPNAGPRHLVWHPSYRYLYTAGETGSSISAWQWDEDRGQLEVIHGLTTRPSGFTGRNTPADIAMHPSGRFVYVTNRGAGTLTGFRIDPSTGRLSGGDQTHIGSSSSWSMACDPTGRWAVASAQIGDEVMVYAVEPETGRLTRTEHTLPVTSPTCVRWA